MAKNSIRDFDNTAGNNTDIQSTDISEGCPASGMNDAIRNLMADLADVNDGTVALETPAADRLDVDNIRLDGNTISSTDTNGNVNIDPAGTGETVIDSSVRITKTSGAPTLVLTDNDTSGDGTIDASDGNLRFYSDNDGEVAGSLMGFYVDGSEAMRINSSGNVGIGTTSPSATTEISTSSGEVLRLTKATGAYLGFHDGTQTRAALQGINGADGLTFHTGSGVTECMRIQADGEVRIGGSSAYPSATGIDPVLLVDINGHSGSFNGGLAVNNIASGEVAYSTVPNGGHTYYAAIFMDSATASVGSITCTTTSTAYNTSSDHRLKENVTDMTGAIARVKALTPKRFNFIADADTTVDGFIAHEAQTVVPEAVTGTHNEVDDDGNAVMQGIDQAKLVPLLTGALQEAIAKIETLETEVTALKARVTALEDA